MRPQVQNGYFGRTASSVALAPSMATANAVMAAEAASYRLSRDRATAEAYPGCGVRDRNYLQARRCHSVGP